MYWLSGGNAEMELSEIFANGSRKKGRKRVGRGIGSGHGKTCGRGHKGAGSRSGTKLRTAFEGGQTPTFRRVAKRGPGCALDDVALVSLSEIVLKFGPNSFVDVESIVLAGMARSRVPVKVVAGVGIDSMGIRISGCLMTRSVLDSLARVGGDVAG